MSKVDWKQKYYELRSKYMNALDTAFQLGFSEGQKEAEMQQMQMEMQRMQEEAAMAAEMGGMEEEMPVDENGMPLEEELPPEEMMEEGGGDELDSSIDELESYVKHEDVKEQLKNLHKSEEREAVKPEKNAKADKVNGILKKWDNEDSEESSDEIIGQA